MAQVNSESSFASETLARNVLRVVAQAHEPAQGIEPLLNMALEATGGTGAAFLIFNEPRILMTVNIDDQDLPDQDLLFSAILDLREGIHVNPVLSEGISMPFDRWMIVPFKQQHNPIACLVIVTQDTGDFHTATLQPILSGLNTLTRTIRNIAHHEKINRNQSEFIRIVLHDLRSPLTSMRGFGSMLESGMVGELNEKQVYFIEKILSGINQMAMLVENVQDAGRYDVENGFYEMERAPCDPVEIVSRIVEQHLIPAEKQELSISTEVTDDIPIINADAGMLDRAISNLVDNAIKYTPNGGNITVGMRTHQDNLIIWVKDSGLGISPDNQKMLFERHVRIPRHEHKKIKGSGLGLFIVRSVAQRHGGSAWVESAEGKGSTFYIKIPLDATGTSA